MFAVLLSQDRGNTWYSTGLVKHNVFISGNGEERQAGERLSIDPQANYTFFGSRKDGMWILYPAGVWEKVGGGLPTTTADPGKMKTNWAILSKKYKHFAHITTVVVMAIL